MEPQSFRRSSERSAMNCLKCVIMIPVLQRRSDQRRETTLRPFRKRSRQKKQDHAARPADERLLNASAADRNRRASR
jgi:hypothetical protein